MTTINSNFMTRWSIRDASLIRLRDEVIGRPGGGQNSFGGRECQSPPESRTRTCKIVEFGYGKRTKENIGCK